jgi:predicted nucleotidyltransferase
MSSFIDRRIINEFNQRAPFKFDEGTLLVFALVGSHSHNTRLPDEDSEKAADSDYIGVIVPPLRWVLGLRSWDNTEFKVEELDCKFYSFHKFMTLMAKGNPNVIDLFFLHSANVLRSHWLWDSVILPRREIFLNKGTTFNAFMGFAHDKTKKLENFTPQIQQEYDYAVEILSAIGITPEQVIRSEQIDQPSHAKLEAVVQVMKKYVEDSTADYTDALLEMGWASRHIRQVHAKFFQGYMGEKRKNLVRKFGYDVRAGAHAVRLMRMLCEYLQAGVFVVWRTEDADELRRIKRGEWTLDQVKTELERLATLARELRPSSKLPESADHDAIERLMLQVYRRVFEIY